MPFTDIEISAFFDPILTVDAVFTPAGGIGTIIKVIFNKEYQTIEMLSGGVGVESSGPVATCKTSDVSGAKHGDTLAISGTTYYISGVQPDGTGITKLLLSEDMANV